MDEPLVLLEPEDDYVPADVQIALINKIEPSSNFLLTGKYLERYRSVVLKQVGFENTSDILDFYYFNRLFIVSQSFSIFVNNSSGISSNLKCPKSSSMILAGLVL